MTNDAQTLTLTEFLLARTAEDEAVARDFAAEGPWQEWALADRSGPRRDDEYAQLTIGAARVLAGCEAKRRIVQECDDAMESGAAEDGQLMTSGANTGHDILRHLAAVYADHPDYREEWQA